MFDYSTMICILIVLMQIQIARVSNVVIKQLGLIIKLLRDKEEIK